VPEFINKSQTLQPHILTSSIRGGKVQQLRRIFASLLRLSRPDTNAVILDAARVHGAHLVRQRVRVSRHRREDELLQDAGRHDEEDHPRHWLSRALPFAWIRSNEVEILRGKEKHIFILIF
jgi:hypothetical protein